jgi:protoporphyrin/coproporphyrin ferrochelatase
MSNKGVLLVNLGSPDSPKTSDVRRYLREFLMDGRVLDTSYPVRFGIVHGCILPFRPKQAAEAYHKVWLPDGSPLVVTSRRVQRELQSRVSVPVEMAMRYQNPSIGFALRQLLDRDVDEILLMTMFPHYAMSTHESVVVKVREELAHLAPSVKLKIVPPYYDEPDYINALVACAEPVLQQGFDHLLFSFHGLPERHLHKSDPTGCHCLKALNCCETPSPAHATCYRAQCFKTVRSFAAQTGITVREYSVAFQSRLGRDPWLQPYTDQVLTQLGKAGVQRLAVICPAFVTDCLETLEEIGMRGRETFLAAGGKEFQLIPCLNEHPRWLAFLERLIGEFVDESDADAEVFAKPTAAVRS